jgi:hypothetical protein
MAERNKFEEMLERLVNEDKAGAEELFHEIVVEKSRDIYEGLLEDDLDDEAVDEASKDDDEETNEASKDDDKDVDEASEDDDKDVEEASKDDDEEATNEDFDLDEFEVAEEDPTDGMMKDMEPAGDMDMDMDMDMDADGDDAPEGDVEDRVVDLEDALDDLKAEFEKMMADGDDDEGDDDAEGDDMDMDADGDGDDEAEEEAMTYESEDDDVEEATDEDDEPKSEAEQMREYVEKVNVTHKDEADNKKSPHAGKNPMPAGGNASNLNKGSAEEKGMTPAKAKEDNAGNVNTPGSKAASKMSGEKAKSGDEAQNKKSTLGS